MTRAEPFTPPAVIDGIFRALSDPTRRRVIERLSAKPSSVSELAAEYRMALPSFVEHLKVLEGTGLVRSKKVGRETVECRSDSCRSADCRARKSGAWNPDQVCNRTWRYMC